MNFVGEYSADRATITVEAEGDNGAKITVQWGSSADEGSEWTMSGVFNDSTKTVNYTNGQKIDYVDDGDQRSETTVYTDGTGEIVFNDNTLQWADDKEHVADGMTFRFGA